MDPSESEKYLFYDEAFIKLDPSIAAVKAPKRKQTPYPSSSLRERLNLAGIVNPRTGDLFLLYIMKEEAVRIFE